MSPAKRELPAPHGYATCPFADCNYWVVFGGFLADFLRGWKQHVRRDHREESIRETRFPGGLIDHAFGMAIVEAWPAGDPLAESRSETDRSTK